MDIAFVNSIIVRLIVVAKKQFTQAIPEQTTEHRLCIILAAALESARLTLGLFD